MSLRHYGYVILVAGVALMTFSLLQIDGWLGWFLAFVNALCVLVALIYIAILRGRYQ